MKVLTGLFLWVLFFVFPWTSQAAQCVKPMSIFTKAVMDSMDRIDALPGYGCLHDVELSGYLPYTSEENTSSGLFYWFVESKLHDAKTPIVLWLNGGPGASSLFGFFLENGPFVVQDNMTLKERIYSWTNKAHFLVIDQPAGVGYSYGTNGSYADEAQAMDQLYESLQGFYKRYPELLSRPLFIAGQSYAGKYIPELAIRIISEKKQRLPLKGILIGDGWVNPLIQLGSDADFAYSHGLVDAKTQAKVKTLYQACAKEIKRHMPSTLRAHLLCSKMQDLIKQSSGCDPLTNILRCQPYDDRNMITYLNQPSVRKAVHVDPRVTHYATFSKLAETKLLVGEQDSAAEFYPQLLDKDVRVVLYQGLEDGTDSNFIGAERWVSALPWAKEHGFVDAPVCIWKVNDIVAGFVKSAAGLTQVKIRHAGHIAPIDQPVVVLALLERVIGDKTLRSYTQFGC